MKSKTIDEFMAEMESHSSRGKNVWCKLSPGLLPNRKILTLSITGIPDREYGIDLNDVLKDLILNVKGYTPAGTLQVEVSINLMEVPGDVGYRQGKGYGNPLPDAEFNGKIIFQKGVSEN